MKTLLMACLGLVGIAMFAAPAQAQIYHGHSGAHANHSRHHDDLDHRAYHRDLDHREAHRYPMTRRQHGGLHDQLGHEAFHDNLEHRGAHRSGAYSPRRSYYGGHSSYYGGYPYSGRPSYYRSGGTSLYLSRPGFSIQIGR